MAMMEHAAAMREIRFMSCSLFWIDLRTLQKRALFRCMHADSDFTAFGEN